MILVYNKWEEQLCLVFLKIRKTMIPKKFLSHLSYLYTDSLVQLIDQSLNLADVKATHILSY